MPFASKSNLTFGIEKQSEDNGPLCALYLYASFSNETGCIEIATRKYS